MTYFCCPFPIFSLSNFPRTSFTFVKLEYYFQPSPLTTRFQLFICHLMEFLQNNEHKGKHLHRPVRDSHVSNKASLSSFFLTFRGNVSNKASLSSLFNSFRGNVSIQGFQMSCKWLDTRQSLLLC
uniref:Uncharacterized protein n=1 Tax=Cacopsylla melanoneura TaxID=428564 RepID=A0A8D8RG82_9HEMI